MLQCCTAVQLMRNVCFKLRHLLLLSSSNIVTKITGIDKITNQKYEERRIHSDFSVSQTLLWRKLSLLIQFQLCFQTCFQLNISISFYNKYRSWQPLNPSEPPQSVQPVQYLTVRLTAQPAKSISEIYQNLFICSKLPNLLSVEHISREGDHFYFSL